MSTRTEQIAALVDGLAAGGQVVVNAYDGSDRPVPLAVVDASGIRRDFRVFCWNVTRGGHGRSEGEFRVQATRAGDAPLYVDGTDTLVLGLHDELGVFAAWDATKHREPSTSASLQIPLETLERAAQFGFAARERPLGLGSIVEVVVAFKPELVGDYLNVLHDLAANDPEEGLVTAAAASGDVVNVEELPVGAQRRRTVSHVSHVIRNAQFRFRVLQAYEYRCGFCGLGARLPQGAHIKPVHLGGLDQVKNGVAACPTHHLAFDRGLILVEDDFSIRLNDVRLNEVGAGDEDRDALAAGLRETLRLPANSDLHPSGASLAAHRAQW
jgi:Methylase-associated X1/HNH endonuclease